MPFNTPLGYPQTPIPGPRMTPVPPPMSLPPGANPPGMGAIPPEMEQNAVIEQIKAMLDSPDPQTRAMGQAYVEKFARTPMGAFLNRLTQGNPLAPQGTPGYSDQAITKPTPQTPTGQYLNRYSPEEMAFGEKLGREISPGPIHGAEMAGTAANLAMLPLTFLRGGAKGAPPAPMSPAGGVNLPTRTQGLPPGHLRQRASELETQAPAGPPQQLPEEVMPGLPQGWPRVVGKDRPAASEKELGKGSLEEAYLRELDKGLPAAGKSKADVTKKIKPMPMAKLRKLLGLPD